MNRIFTLLIAALIGTFALVWFNRDSGFTFGLTNDDFVRAMSLVLLLAAVGFRAISGGNLGATARNLSIWGIIALGFVTAYQYRFELQDVASRVTLGLVPSRPQSMIDASGAKIMAIEKSASGHFEIDAAVNGGDVKFLIDTGASGIVLTLPDAEAAGIDVSQLSYSVPVSTANGMTLSAPARVGEIIVGDIVRRDLPVLISERGQLDQSLLGMDFLNTLSGFSVERDRLTLKD
ncbi:MAG: TIGR02281 family clan AA aspartic protease [Rhizobiaceae bacterium]